MSIYGKRVYSSTPNQYAGDWKRRRAEAEAHRAREAAAAPLRAAGSLIRDQHTRRRSLTDRIAAAERNVDITKGTIEQAVARLDELRTVDLTAAKRAVVAARDALAALDGDLERAQAIMDAQAVLEANP